MRSSSLLIDHAIQKPKPSKREARGRPWPKRASACFVLSLFAFSLLAHLTSCHFHRLEVQTQYIGEESLASFVVATPDPRIANPPIGQRLLIQWWLDQSEWQKNSCYLALRVRFRNHQECEQKIAIDRAKGYCLYQVQGALFRQTGGVITYLAEIIQLSKNEGADQTEERTEEVIARFQHPLWKTLINPLSQRRDIQTSDVKRQPKF